MSAIHGLFLLFALLVLVQVNGSPVENISGRIINGNDVTTQYRYHAHLLLDGADDQITRVGSGVLLTTRLIITAAQNIFGFETYRAGFGDVVRDDLIWRTAMTGVTAYDYNPATLENNYGFLIFNIGAFDIIGVSPISLPNIMFGNDLPYQNEQGRVVGFGHTTNGDDFADYLQYAYKRVISQNDCAATYPNHTMEHSFCAYDTINHGKICGGDQGGAFVTLVNGREYLTGISSYVLGTDCIRDQPALFVRLLHYRQYIETFVLFFN